MLTIEEAIRQRHSVRQYTDEPICADMCTALNEEIARCNAQGDLHMALVCDEPKAFAGGLAHYGSFRGMTDYLVIAGKPATDLDERAGYFGEKVVLLAQQLGLNTCWVALTFKKRLVKKTIAPGEKLAVVVAIGHGVTQGAPHKSKGAEAVSHCADAVPAWFACGVELALLAPTAMHQQKFRFELLESDSNGGHASKPRVKATTARGAYANIDLGIAKLHFEIGAGKDTFEWA